MIRQLRSAPNQLTLLRLIFIPFVVISVVEDRYGWALALFVLAGLSDALDGLLARVLKQKTALGQYLDPIADKLLLSTLFLVLAFEHRIPWYVTVLVFSRDLGILIVSALLYGNPAVVKPSELTPGPACPSSTPCAGTRASRRTSDLVPSKAARR